MSDRERSLDPAVRWARDKYLGQGFGDTSRKMVLKELREALFSIVDDYLEETGQKEPEFKPELLAPKRKIKAIVEAPLSKAKALLIPQIGGFVLKIRSNMHLFQRRFSCAHEIGHTFFFNINADPPRKEFQQQKSRYWVEEEFSSAIAREILLPTPSIREVVQRDCPSPSISALRFLSGIYKVSFEVLRTKLINDTPLWDCIFLKAFLSNGKAIVRKRDVSKGVSYRDIHIPQIIEKNSAHSEFFRIISSTTKAKRLKTEKINLNEKEYLIETALLNYVEPVVIGILTQ